MITSEAVQRWVRIGLYYLWGGLGTYGITVGDQWQTIAASIFGFVVTAVWTKYGSTVNAMLTEVGKMDGIEKAKIEVDPQKIDPASINSATPSNVVAQPER